MTRPARPPSPAVRKRSLLRQRIHRTTGVTTGAVLVYLIATGLPLQFTSTLELGGRYVQSPLLLDWYGIRAPDSAWQSGEIIHVGNLILIGNDTVAEADQFRGAVTTDTLHVIATAGTLLLMPVADPGTIETLRLNTDIRRIGLTSAGVMLDTGSGYEQLDLETLELHPSTAAAAVSWAMLSTVSGEVLSRSQQAARARVLSVERLLQDLHSGRAFGAVGEWLVSLASIALAVLALSGFWIWWRTR